MDTHSVCTTSIVKIRAIGLKIITRCGRCAARHHDGRLAVIVQTGGGIRHDSYHKRVGSGESHRLRRGTIVGIFCQKDMSSRRQSREFILRAELPVVYSIRIGSYPTRDIRRINHQLSVVAARTGDVSTTILILRYGERFGNRDHNLYSGLTFTRIHYSNRYILRTRNNGVWGLVLGEMLQQEAF